MPTRRDDRCVSTVIGFILIFAIVVVAWTAYQGLAVPQQERGIELEHNERVHAQFQEVRNAVQRVSVTGASESVSIRLGATYPQRFLGMSLATSAGELRTTTVHTPEENTIGVTNARALDPETADYWNGTADRTFRTKFLVYRPTYTRYTDAPDTVYTSSVVYNRFGPAGPNLTVTDHAIVDGRRLTLIAIDGNLTAAHGDTEPVTIAAESASTTRVAVRNASEDPIEVTVPTRLTAEEWAELLAEETCVSADCSAPADEAAGRHVLPDPTVVDGELTIRLEPGVVYDLRLAKVGVGTGATPEGPRYLTVVRRPVGTVLNGTTHRVSVEVRDRFNNPVSGVEVTASADEGNFDQTTADADATGRAAFAYTAPETAGTDEVTLTVLGGGSDSHRVEFELEVREIQWAGGPGPPRSPGPP